MKKPEGKADSGWYDHPELEGYEKYWNGKFWTKKNRLIGEEGPSVIPADAKYLGRFLFRFPIGGDGAFIAYLVTVGLFSIFEIKQETVGGLNLATAITSLFGLVTMIPWVYILFLLYLVPRRIVDKKRGLQKYTPENEIDIVENKTNNQSKKAFIVVGVFVILTILVIVGLKQSSKSEGDKYFEIEQRISSVVGEWNLAATPISQAIQEVSNGTMSEADARKIAGEASSQFAVVNNHLQDACSFIPAFDLNATGEEGAFAKAYNALKVACDLLPSESVEVLLLINEQISPISTQAQIDYHVSQINEIISKKRQAVLDSINAILPYVTSAQKDAIERLRKSLG